MKILTSLLSLFLINFPILSQFDRVNLDPVSSNPSYVGSISQNRVIFKEGTFTGTNTFQASYDFFSEKLKGGWGISANYTKTNFQAKYQEYNLAYSPKLTFNGTGVTWAPALKVSYHNNSISEEERSAGRIGSSGLGFTLGLNRNTKKSLIGGYADINPFSKSMEYKMNYSYKFKFKNHIESKRSATLFVEPRFNYRYGNDFEETTLENRGDVNDLFENNTWPYTVSNFNNYSELNYDKRQFHLLISYTARFRWLLLGVEFNPNILELDGESYDISSAGKIGYVGDRLEAVLIVSSDVNGINAGGGIVYKFGKTK